MTRKIYHCRVCGSMVEVLGHGGDGLSCCGAALDFLGESGGQPNQQKPAALLDLVEVRENGQSCWQFLPPGEPPEAAFGIRASDFTRRENNPDGLWKA